MYLVIHAQISAEVRALMNYFITQDTTNINVCRNISQFILVKLASDMNN